MRKEERETESEREDEKGRNRDRHRERESKRNKEIEGVILLLREFTASIKLLHLTSNGLIRKEGRKDRDWPPDFIASITRRLFFPDRDDFVSKIRDSFLIKVSEGRENERIK